MAAMPGALEALLRSTPSPQRRRVCGDRLNSGSVSAEPAGAGSASLRLRGGRRRDRKRRIAREGSGSPADGGSHVHFSAAAVDQRKLAGQARPTAGGGGASGADVSLMLHRTAAAAASGEYAELIIPIRSATYTYTIGAGGAAGTAAAMPGAPAAVASSLSMRATKRWRGLSRSPSRCFCCHRRRTRIITADMGVCLGAAFG